MKSVTIEQMRRDLDALITEVAAGQTIEIRAGGGSRTRPIARMVPIDSAQQGPDEDAIPATEVEEAFHGD